MRIAIALIMVAAPATAQKTTCSTYAGVTNCETRQMGGVDWSQAGPGFDASQVMNSYYQARQQQMIEQQQRILAEQQAQIAAQQAAPPSPPLSVSPSAFREAADMIIAGRCSDAVAFSLQHPETINSVRAMCKVGP